MFRALLDVHFTEQFLELNFERNIDLVKQIDRQSVIEDLNSHRHVSSRQAANTVHRS